MLTRAYVIAWFRDLFPSNAVFDVSSRGEDLVVKIHWPVTAGDREMSSRRIHMRISKEAFEDYLESAEYKNSARELLREFIERKLSTFKPEYKPEKYPEPPVESWHVTTNIFAIL